MINQAAFARCKSPIPRGANQRLAFCYYDYGDSALNPVTFTPLAGCGHSDECAAAYLVHCRRNWRA